MSTSDDRNGSRERLVRFGAALVLPLVVGLGACAERVEAGLANAPSLERSDPPVHEHDVIANADDSCPRSVGAPDPIPGRAAPCQGEVFDDAGNPVLDAAPDAAYASRPLPGRAARAP